MSDRNPRVRRSGNSSCDPRHNLEGDRSVVQLLRFLAATTEDERIAAFETNDALPFTREPDEKRVDLALAHRVLRPAAFPDVIQLGEARLTGSGGKERRAGQRVIDDCVG